MIKILNELEIKTHEEIFKAYSNCKFIIADLDLDNLSNLQGHLYAISTNKSSENELHKICRELTSSGRPSVVCGQYEHGMDVSVQFEIKQEKPEPFIAPGFRPLTDEEYQARQRRFKRLEEIGYPLGVIDEEREYNPYEYEIWTLVYKDEEVPEELIKKFRDYERKHNSRKPKAKFILDLKNGLLIFQVDGHKISQRAPVPLKEIYEITDYEEGSMTFETNYGEEYTEIICLLRRANFPKRIKRRLREKIKQLHILDIALERWE